MTFYYVDTMGLGRQWAAGLLSLNTYCSLQFWAAIIVLAACIPQLHLARKFRFPAEPGRLTILGGYIGLRLQELHLGSGRLTLALGSAGYYLDFAAMIIGRVGIALQAVDALFAIDDIMAAPKEPRPLITWMLVAIVMVQCRSLTAYSPRERSD